MSATSYISDAFRSPATKKTWPWIIASPFIIILCEYLAVARIGSQFFLGLELPFILGLLGAIPAVIILPLFLFVRKSRRTIFAWLLACAIFIPLAIAGFVIGKNIRSSAFHDLAIRSECLVSAIHDYTAKIGTPPNSLDALVPEYLSEVPKTGMMAYSEYRYEVGEAAERYEGNPWILRVFTSSGGINFDEFMYFPLQNYPDRGYGGSFERINEWAYLHE